MVIAIGDHVTTIIIGFSCSDSIILSCCHKEQGLLKNPSFISPSPHCFLLSRYSTPRHPFPTPHIFRTGASIFLVPTVSEIFCFFAVIIEFFIIEAFLDEQATSTGTADIGFKIGIWVKIEAVVKRHFRVKIELCSFMKGADLPYHHPKAHRH